MRGRDRVERTGEACRQGASGSNASVDAAKSTVERLAGPRGRLRDGGNAAERGKTAWAGENSYGRLSVVSGFRRIGRRNIGKS